MSMVKMIKFDSKEATKSKKLAEAELKLKQLKKQFTDV
jgi:hypothetical protein